MKTLPSGMAAHLAGGATTLAWCWRLTRRDGTTLGFTDHDVDITFDGTTFEAAAGFTASQMQESIGLGVDNLEVESALSSGRLSDSDLAAGLYDNARVEIYRVNWQSTDQRVLMRSGSLGQVKRNGLSFTAEVRGLAQYLQQPSGRLYQFGCDADLGDQRCGVALASAAYRGTGTVASLLTSRVFVVTGLDSYAVGWFSRGLWTLTSGEFSGTSVEVKSHASSGTGIALELWHDPPRDLLVGDTFHVSAGCDKQLATCLAKFANTANFRGFPHMPGNDFLTINAAAGS